METTRLSSKGQIVVPKSIRAARDWTTGTEFTVEETREGILLRPAGRFAATELAQVAGCLSSKRQSRKTGQTRTAVEREVSRRRDSGRY